LDTFAAWGLVQQNELILNLKAIYSIEQSY